MAPKIITTGKSIKARTEQEIREQAIEALGLDAQARFEYITADNHIIRIPHPLLRPAGMKRAVREYGKRDVADQDDDDYAAIIIGEDADAFVEHGGDTDLLTIELARRQMQGMDHMTGRPIRS